MIQLVNLICLEVGGSPSWFSYLGRGVLFVFFFFDGNEMKVQWVF